MGVEMASRDPLSKEIGKGDAETHVIESSVNEISIADKLAELEKDIIAERKAIEEAVRNMHADDLKSKVEFSTQTKKRLELELNIRNIKKSIQELQADVSIIVRPA